MSKVSKLIWFPEDLAERVDDYRKKEIAENLKDGQDDFNISFTQVVLELIEDGLATKKK